MEAMKTGLVCFRIFRRVDDTNISNCEKSMFFRKKDGTNTFMFFVCCMNKLQASYEQPPLFGKERNSLWMETFFFSNPPCLWERGRG